MSGNLVYLPSPSGEQDGYLNLSKTPQGRLLRKKILPMNDSFVHPSDKKTKIYVDRQMAQSLVDNFNKGYSTVQVPIVNDNNQHVEDPLRNAGEVIDLEYDDSGVYATIDARKYADDFGKTILGASAFMHLDYTDTHTGEHVGPTLLHVAATNRPYVNHLGDYEELIAASADIQDEQPILFVRDNGTDEPEEELTLSNDLSKDGQMTKEEWLEAGKELGFDVEALQTEAAKAAELSGQLEEASKQLQLSAGSEDSVSVTDLAEAFLELSNSNKEQSAQISSLMESNAKFAQQHAEAEVDELIKAGRVLPKQRDVLVRLSMDDRETFDSLVPDTSIVSLSESGVTVHEESLSEKTAAEVDRYKAMAERISHKK